MKEFGDTIHIDNFFTEDQLQLCEKVASLAETAQSIYPYGVFPNQLIAEFKQLHDDEVVRNMFIDIFANLLECEKSNFDFSAITLVSLYLPWDIHNDLHKNKIKDISDLANLKKLTYITIDDKNVTVTTYNDKNCLYYSFSVTSPFSQNKYEYTYGSGIDTKYIIFKNKIIIYFK